MKPLCTSGGLFGNNNTNTNNAAGGGGFSFGNNNNNQQKPGGFSFGNNAGNNNSNNNSFNLGNNNNNNTSFGNNNNNNGGGGFSFGNNNNNQNNQNNQNNNQNNGSFSFGNNNNNNQNQNQNNNGSFSFGNNQNNQNQNQNQNQNNNPLSATNILSANLNPSTPQIGLAAQKSIELQQNTILSLLDAPYGNSPLPKDLEKSKEKEEKRITAPTNPISQKEALQKSTSGGASLSSLYKIPKSKSLLNVVEKVSGDRLKKGGDGNFRGQNSFSPKKARNISLFNDLDDHRCYIGILGKSFRL